MAPKITSTASSLRTQSGPTVADRKHLHNCRVVQRNLVYIIGVPVSYANEDMLRKAEYFGQYGKIGKIVIHRNHSSNHSTVSVYVTFVHKEDAKAAIQALDSYWMDGHILRASFGTTKYCNNFIRVRNCQKSIHSHVYFCGCFFVVVFGEGFSCIQSCGYVRFCSL